MTSSVYHLLSGGFSGGNAPFGLHPKDKERAQAYFSAAYNAGLQWPDIESDIRHYLAKHNAKLDEIEKQLERARAMVRR